MEGFKELIMKVVLVDYFVVEEHVRGEYMVVVQNREKYSCHHNMGHTILATNCGVD